MKVLNGFLKWLAALAICLAAGLAAIIYFSSRPDLGEFWLRLIVLLAMAFIGSLAFRLFFHKLPGFFLFLITLLTEILALLAIDYFYGGDYGFIFLKINPEISTLSINPMDEFIASIFVLTAPAPREIAQFILMILVMLPTLFFLRRKKKPAKIQAEPAPTVPVYQEPKPQVSLSQRAQPVIDTINPANWQVTRDVSKQVKKITKTAEKVVSAKPVRVSAASKSTSKSVKTGTTVKPTVKKPAAVKPAAARKPRNSQANDVKLMGEEEHVCPYCLEKVNKNDKKVICPECGTWHHQDCWDLTGTCGVAHRNEL